MEGLCSMFKAVSTGKLCTRVVLRGVQGGGIAESMKELEK